MTTLELEKYKERLFELKLLIENTTVNIKFYPKINKYKEDLIAYTKEFKKIDKILKKARKEALKNGL